jgi:hypothetical protein
MTMNFVISTRQTVDKTKMRKNGVNAGLNERAGGALHRRAKAA